MHPHFAALRHCASHSCEAIYACVEGSPLRSPLNLSRYYRKIRIHNPQATREELTVRVPLCAGFKKTWRREWDSARRNFKIHSETAKIDSSH